MTYFPFAEYWWLYLGFTAFVLLLLALDLGVFHRKAHAISMGEAGVWSAVWIGLALAFNFGLYLYASWQFQHDPRLLQIPGFDPISGARQVGLEFLAGYVVEKTLSLDNIFVFVLVFRFFGTPAAYQHRVLFYGIVGALVFRAVFIALGSALLQYHWIIVLFGVFLILTGVKMVLAPEREIAPERNPLVRLFRRFVPITPEPAGERFLIRRNGLLYATPLFITLLFVEASDILFAIDSVPAVFALTREPLIVFTSNVFAMLGLRALYFLLAGAVERFALLKYGLAAVLVFVGLKMVWLNDAFGGNFPIGWSLGIIAGVIFASIGGSLLSARGRAGVQYQAKNTEGSSIRPVTAGSPRQPAFAGAHLNSTPTRTIRTMKKLSSGNLLVLAATALVVPSLASGTTREQIELERQGVQLTQTLEQVARDIHTHADQLQSISRNAGMSRWSHHHHLTAIRTLLNNDLKEIITKLVEIQPRMPQWKLESIDKMLAAAQALAADTHSAILTKNESGSIPVALNTQYRELVDRVYAHAQALVKTADATGTYGAARLKAYDAGVNVPRA